MKTFLLISSLLFAGSVFADSAKDLKVFRKAMESIVGKTDKATSVRLLISKSDNGVCGRSGPSLIAEYQITKYQEETETNVYGHPILRPRFQTVKTYGVPTAYVSQLSIEGLILAISDTDDCQN